MDNFEDELRDLINRYNQEAASNTPDFILTKFLGACLVAFNTAVQQRNAKPCKTATVKVYAPPGVTVDVVQER